MSRMWWALIEKVTPCAEEMATCCLEATTYTKIYVHQLCGGAGV